MNFLLDYSALFIKSIVWFEFILDVTVKCTIIMGLASLIMFFGKRTTASMRHLILFFAILSLIIMPLLSTMLPAWEIPFLTSVTLQTSLNQVTDSKEKDIASQTAKNDDDVNVPFRLHWPVVLMFTWLIGTTCLFLRHIIGLFGRWWMIRKASPVADKELRQILNAHCKRTGIHQPIRLLQSPRTAVPLTWGYFHPTILLPDNMKQWSDKRKAIVLLHEFAHIKRGDALTSSIAQVASIFHWFNPLFWTILRQFYIEREHASDNVVLTAGTKASDYAHHLLDIARTLTSVRWTSPVEVAMAQKPYLEGRLLSILNKKEQRNPIKKSTIVAIGLLAFLVMLPLASIQPWAKNETTNSNQIDDKDMIKKTLLSYNNAFENQDFERLYQHYTCNYFDQSGYNRDEAVTKWKKNTYIKFFKDMKKNLVDSEIIKIEKKDDSTYYLYEKFCISGIDKYGNLHYQIKNSKKLYIFKKEDGKWKIDYIKYKEIQKGT